MMPQVPESNGVSYAESLERSLADAGYIGTELGSRYAAAVKLARSLAAKMDDLERHGWLNSIDRPDTATPGQYLRALEALGLVPPKRAAQAPEKERRQEGARRSSVSSFRERHGLRVVG